MGPQSEEDALPFQGDLPCETRGPLVLSRTHLVLQKRKGKFQSPLILETFAVHLTETQGTTHEFYKSYEPQGALALACVAV